jgi:hypothetical protein
MPFIIEGNFEGSLAARRGMVQRTADQVQAVGTELAAEITADARGNHPYQNQSGALEAGTQPVVNRVDAATVEFGVTVNQNVRSPQGYYYPWRIEHGFDGRFQTLEPAKQRATAKVMQRLKEIKPK